MSDAEYQTKEPPLTEESPVSWLNKARQVEAMDPKPQSNQEATNQLCLLAYDGWMGLILPASSNLWLDTLWTTELRMNLRLDW